MITIKVKEGLFLKGDPTVVVKFLDNCIEEGMLKDDTNRVYETIKDPEERKIFIGPQGPVGPSGLKWSTDEDIELFLDKVEKFKQKKLSLSQD